jgi:hypothetical protein
VILWRSVKTFRENALIFTVNFMFYVSNSFRNTSLKDVSEFVSTEVISFAERKILLGWTH